MDFRHYLIISNVCIVISFLLFRLLNRDETMFRQRRIFILLSVTLSLLLPLTGFRIILPFQTDAPVQKPINELTHVNMQVQEKVESSGIDALSYIYLVVLSLFLLNILFQLSKVLWLYLSGKKENGHIILVESNRVLNPFSFFNWIFIPKNRTSVDELKSIIIHESIHSRQYHTVDNILLEIACAVMWFNPFVWMMKKSLHLIHEYLADEGTLNSGVEKITYQSLLINQVAEDKLIVIPSSFKNNYLKKRFIMMAQNKNADHNSLIIRKMISLSLLIILVSLLQGFFPVNLNGQNQSREIKDKQVEKEKSGPIVVTGYGTQDSVPANIRIRNTGGNTLFILDGREVSKDVFESLPPDQIQSMSVLKNKEQMRIYTQKDYDGVIVITTKNDPGINDEKSPKMKTIVVTGYGTPDTVLSKSIKIRSTGGSDIKNTLFIVDEKEVSREYFENINPDTIKSISVLKNKEQMAIYTSKDYDGVIIITTIK